MQKKLQISEADVINQTPAYQRWKEGDQRYDELIKRLKVDKRVNIIVYKNTHDNLHHVWDTKGHDCKEWDDALYEIRDDFESQILQQVPEWEEWWEDLCDFWEDSYERQWKVGERRETIVETRYGIIQVAARCEEVSYELQDGILFSED